jgi:hypothetical protein
MDAVRPGGGLSQRAFSGGLRLVMPVAALDRVLDEAADDRDAGGPAALAEHARQRRGRGQPLAEQPPGLRMGPDVPDVVHRLLESLAPRPGADPVTDREPDDYFHAGYISLSSR